MDTNPILDRGIVKKWGVLMLIFENERHESDALSMKAALEEMFKFELNEQEWQKIISLNIDRDTRDVLMVCFWIPGTKHSFTSSKPWNEQLGKPQKKDREYSPDPSIFSVS